MGAMAAPTPSPTPDPGRAPGGGPEPRVEPGAARRHEPRVEHPSDGLGPGVRSSLHWVLLAAAPLCWVALGLFRFLLEPDARGFGTHQQLGLKPCASMEWAGIPCPGCGVTTSVTQVAHGQPLTALATQPFGWFVALVLAVYPVWALVQWRRGRDLGDEAFELLNLRRALSVGALMLVAWLYKLGRVFELF